MVFQNADKVLLCAIVLISTIGIASCLDVTAANCVDNSGDECKGITNAECAGDSGSGPCQCAQSFESTTDPTKCTAIALNGACRSEADCTNLPNTACNKTCKCAVGFKEDGGQCKLGLGGHCSTTADCTANVVNALCDKTCKCGDGFKASQDGSCKQAVSGKTCTASGTECGKIDNAECDKTALKCKCSDGYVENANKCDTKSGAVAVKSAFVVMLGNLILLLTRVM